MDLDQLLNKTKQNDSPYRLEPTHRHVFGICLCRKPRKQPFYWHKMCLEYKIYICRHLSFRCTFQSSNQCTDWMCFLRWSMIFLRHMVYTQHHRLNRLHCSIFQQGTRRIDRQNQDQHSPKNDLQKKVNQIKTRGKTVGNSRADRRRWSAGPTIRSRESRGRCP